MSELQLDVWEDAEGSCGWACEAMHEAGKGDGGCEAMH